ncbi:hypothetical protein PSTT_07626 [Puccinia striiformis]|uniref:Cytochrome c oxidase subunit IV n=2 Tax=Puccinia striiformis TaxID=27350 RepID=A0A2S4VG28_9BASI|nr:hypothetical protein PSTT_07626 [Puccinia striiformis]
MPCSSSRNLDPKNFRLERNENSPRVRREQTEKKKPENNNNNREIKAILSYRQKMLTNAANRLVVLQRAIQPASGFAPTLGLRSSFKIQSRNLATVAVSADQSSSTSRTSSLPSISNIEAAWKEMSPQEQESIFHHLEGLQKKDWTQLSLDEKKASYWVSFGPHGPREPLHAPGSGVKLLLGITGCISAAIALFVLIRSASPELPRTMTKEWQEAATQRAIDQKMDPFTGASAQGEKAKTFVQSK